MPNHASPPSISNHPCNNQVCTHPPPKQLDHTTPRTRGVSNPPRCPPEQRHRPVATALEPGEHHDAQQVAEVQALCRGVEAAVDEEALLPGHICQVSAGHLLDQAARLEHLHDVGQLLV